jgi:hypothetical protein
MEKTISKHPKFEKTPFPALVPSTSRQAVAGAIEAFTARQQYKVKAEEDSETELDGAGTPMYRRLCRAVWRMRLDAMQHNVGVSHPEWIRAVAEGSGKPDKDGVEVVE